MTPTEQDKELREKLTKLISQDGWVDTQEVDVDGQVNELVAIITADRKRVALEARIDENNMYIRELTRHYFPSGPGKPHIPLVQFHERIAELKAQQEEVK